VNRFGRRDFLKLITTIPAGMVLSKMLPHLGTSNPALPNIIVVVLDALTARNMSLYGYPRRTTPHIERFASRADVYHAHHSAGTFTSSGVASLLTGTYPWSHRVINLKGLIARDRYKRNIFNLLHSLYGSVAFTQNYFADYLLSQMAADIEHHLPISSWSEFELYAADVAQKDRSMKFRAYDDFLYAMDTPTPASLLFGTINKHKKIVFSQKKKEDRLQYYAYELFYNLDSVFSGLASQITDLESPAFCYFHLYPPHGPYLPEGEFLNLFQDGWQPIEKPIHPLPYVESYESLNRKRTQYDQYLAMTDAAFGRFLDGMDRAGLLKNSYLLLTSDHGESFERGYFEHAGPMVYEPSVHVPLLISAPGQTTRRDFYSVTNSVDLLPTLLKISDLETPDWSEGLVLPGFGGEVDNTRLTFSMDAKNASAFGYLTPITIAMYEGNYKLIYYQGYGGENARYHKGLFELYNLKDDPEEMQDLIDDEADISKRLKERLLAAYNAASAPLNQIKGS